jgi:predicted NBD/HSP70 family sugar kinase
LPSYPGSILHQAAVLDLRAVNSALKEGDALARDKVHEAANYFGLGLVNLINSYDPNVIILGDGLNLLGEPLLQTVREVITEHMLPAIYEDVRVELSSLEADPVLIGMAALALDNLMTNPTPLFDAAPDPEEEPEKTHRID